MGYNFIKSQWLGIIMIILFMIFYYTESRRAEKYKEEQAKLKIEIATLNLKLKKNYRLIDSLKQIDGVYVEKIDTIKIKEYEKIYIIDSLPANPGINEKGHFILKDSRERMYALLSLIIPSVSMLVNGYLVMLNF